MEEISNAICMGILSYLSVEDVRKRKIPLVILTVGGCMAFIYQLMWGTEDIWEIAKRYSTCVTSIIEENELSGERLEESGMLIIPIVS